MASCLACRPNCSRVEGSPMSFLMAATQAAVSPGGTSMPFTPSSMTSLICPCAVAITAVPEAMYSNTFIGEP